MYLDWAQSVIEVDNEIVYYTGTYSEPYSPITTTVIAPKSEVVRSPIGLNVNFKNTAGNKYSERIIKGQNAEDILVKEADYTKENSPLFFYSYLVFYFEEEHLITFEDGFYISNVMKLKNATVESLPVKITNKGNVFYLEKNKNKKAINSVVAGLKTTKMILHDLLSSDSGDSDSDY